ncbi:DUF4250 domain-containing protein [Clostridium sp.]|uniref:DUF4250 domain-containing protein n=1 Tax=Clostridium sp. TaxID=1506 RepID=UPI002A91CBDF|nr:DUF4250 domain-containing protein [Clostridium sp.]MDY6012551.1 DUF4250 domain-containing protein [Clostridium sp.]
MNNEEIKSMDANILVSIINLKLRDFYSNIDILCEDMNIDKNLLIEKLNNNGYEYKNELNQFK